MSCIFCSGNDHVSHNCDKYKSNEERESVVRHGNYIHFKFYYEFVNQKCFICFSLDHYTVFCPNRFTVPDLFPPKIDKNLVSRFLQVLKVEEKYMLCLSYPDNFKLCKLEPIKVEYQEEISVSDIKNASDCDFFAADKAIIENVSREFDINDLFNDDYTLDSIGVSEFKHISIYLRHIKINCSSIISSEFLQLLSPKTRNLNCENVEFKPKLFFVEILKRAPYLEEIEIHQTNVYVEYTWPNDLLQLNHSERLKHVHFIIDPDFYFNVKILATLMEKRHVNISLSIMQPRENDFDKELAQKLSTYFVPYNFNLSSSLTINIVDKSFNIINYKKYELKDV